ncbi:SRPBCC domain-containing protein [Brevibacillus nitrificans]|uniref:SRPBCC domain-containing protein n=1 Tax=Brevibacillus nitrificans TaxID=651560 RepID=A0A3M8D8Q3_9BACL|nr:SRPBCC domain-containing protein [Brevibacillus nitrificans]RNB84049.1 SRPBCC domain-containing protein [Brevibacillus nitrificans]
MTAIPDIVHTLVLNAPIQKVWEAVSTAEGIAAWFMPNNFQAIEGHTFTIFSPFGDSPCVVKELDPPHRLVFSWGKDWVATFSLKELGDKTEFTLIHSGWTAGTVTEMGDTHDVIRERMNQGWDSSVLPKLRAYVEQ